MSQKFLRTALLLFSFTFLCVSFSFAQTIKVTGKVSDANTNSPISGATVKVKGSSNDGTAAGEDGVFSIEVPANGTLIFSSSGYDTKEVSVNNRTKIDESLYAKSGELSDVVVIGYGTRQRKDLTGSISTIKPKDIEKSTALSPELSMQGTMSGVDITSGGSNPTARPTVRIRGVSSINFSDPLYVIDGIPLVEGGAGAVVDKTNDPTRRGSINLYTIINPNDIESISVLKDASAAAIYGVRAGNGVILITTKSGKRGRVRVDFDGTVGQQKVPKTYDVLNTQQYVKFYTDAYNAHPDVTGGVPKPIGSAEYFGPKWDPSNAEFIGNNPTYDWQHEAVNQSSMLKNYNLRVSGGSETTTYNFSAGFADNDGPFVGYNAKRYSISSNATSKIGKYLETGINLRAIQQTTHPGTGGIDLNVWQAAPWQKIYDPAGPGGYAPLWSLDKPLTPGDFTHSTLYSKQYVAYSNVFALNDINEAKIDNQTFIGTGYLQVQPIAGLKIKGTINGQQSTITSKQWNDFNRWWFGENPDNPFASVVDPVAGSTPGIVSYGVSTTTSLTKAFNIDYQKTFGLHTIDLTADASEQTYSWTGSGAERSVVSNNPDLRYFSTTGKERGYVELRAKYALIGYFARASYNYNSKYYLDAVVRRDGSSRFAPGKKWGTFMTASGAWRISQESFFKGISFINDLKIRGGYGELGNEQTTGGWAYASSAGIPPPSYNVGEPNGNVMGIAFSSFPNADLTWERIKTANIGFDAVMLNNSVSFSAEYYHKLTKGIIQTVSLTPSAGISAPADFNVANLLNSGFEFNVGYTKTFGEVGFNFTGNFTTVHNEVSNLFKFNTTGASALRGNTFSLENGYPLGYMYGYKVGGIFQTQKEIDDFKAKYDDRIAVDTKPGDMYFLDLYGEPTLGSTDKNLTKDGVINANDQTYLGKTIPGFYYGFSTGANYKGFDISVSFFGKGDVQKYNSVRAQGEGMNGYGRNQFSTVLNAWTEQNHSNSMPRAVYGDPNANLRFSDRFIENAGFLRLQNLQVGYNFPSALLAKTNAIQNLRLYVSGINLFTITDYSGLDPENDFFPNTRQLLIGLKASF
jgi:TonB-dependent starch-binding outer membrane protein SusC